MFILSQFHLIFPTCAFLSSTQLQLCSNNNNSTIVFLKLTVVAESKLCKHKGGCVVNTIRGFLRGLVIGLLVKGGFSVVVNVFWKKLYKKPNQLKAAIFDPATKDFALFLAFFVSSFKGVHCLMKNIRETDDGLNSLISGAVSGLSVLFSGRSIEMIMFCFSKVTF